MSAPTSTDWVIGYQAFIDAEGRTKAYSREPVRWNGVHWESLGGRGAWSPQCVTSVSPLYMVSLDAAIEAVARHKFEATRNGTWESAREETRADYRDAVRDDVTAAVMGGAQ